MSCFYFIFSINKFLQKLKEQEFCPTLSPNENKQSFYFHSGTIFEKKKSLKQIILENTSPPVTQDNCSLIYFKDVNLGICFHFHLFNTKYVQHTIQIFNLVSLMSLCEVHWCLQTCRRHSDILYIIFYFYFTRRFLSEWYLLYGVTICGQLNYELKDTLVSDIYRVYVKLSQYMSNYNKFRVLTIISNKLHVQLWPWSWN